MVQNTVQERGKCMC